MQTKDEKYASKLEKLLKRWGVDNEEDIKAFVEDAIKLVNDDEEEVEDIEPKTESEEPETEVEEEKEPETEVVEEEPKEEDIETETHQEEIQDTIDTITKRIDALEDLIEKLADSKEEGFGLKGSNQGEPEKAVSYQDKLNRLRKGY